MNELLSFIEQLIEDFLFWPALIFVGFCITNAILPEKKERTEEEFEESLK